MKLSSKITFISSGIILLIGAAISYLVYTSNIASLETHIEDRLKNQAFHTMDKLDRMLFERHGDIKTLSTDPVLISRTSTPKQITEKLMAYKNNYKVYISLSFFDLNRIRIADTSGKDIGKQHTFSEYWKKQVTQGVGVTADITESESLHMTVMHFASVVRDKDGIPFGVVVARVPTEQIYGIIKQSVGIYNIGKDFRVELLDKEGHRIYSSFKSGMALKETLHHWGLIKQPLAVGVVVGTARHLDQMTKEYDILIFAREQGYMDFKGSDWVFIIEAPADIVFASAVTLKNRMIVIFVIIAVLSFIIMHLISSRITQAIEDLDVASREISKGNLDVRVGVTSSDEIGSLSESFNRMASDLKESKGRLLEYSRGLEEKVKQRTSELQMELAKHKKTGEELRQNQERLGALIETAPVLIVLIDGKGRIVIFNKACEDLTGYNRSEVIGKTVPELFLPPEWVAVVLKRFADPYLPEACAPHENPWKTKSGEERLIEWRCNVLPSPETEKPYILGIGTDITTKRQMETELEKGQRLESIGVLAGGIAHDFNNLLTAILGNISLARMYTKPDDKIFTRLSKAEEACLLAKELTNSLITFSKGGAPVRNTIHLSKILKDAVGYSLIGYNVSYDLTIPDNLYPVDIDEFQIIQAISNIVINARESMPEGGTMKVLAQNATLTKKDNLPLKEGDYIRVSIKDHGKGIPKENLSRIFDPYFTTKDMGREKGSGLGLSISYSIIKRHEGHITVESESGSGTIVNLYIPASISPGPSGI